MADSAGSVDSTVAVVGAVAAVVDVGIPAMPPGTVGIAGTAACTVGLQHWQSRMKWPGLLRYFEACYNNQRYCKHQECNSSLLTEIESR